MAKLNDDTPVDRQLLQHEQQHATAGGKQFIAHANSHNRVAIFYCCFFSIVLSTYIFTLFTVVIAMLWILIVHQLLGHLKVVTLHLQIRYACSALF